MYVFYCFLILCKLFVLMIIVYECIVNAPFANPANDNIWNYMFQLLYCHGPGYDHHLYVQILWNFSIKINKLN